MRVEAVSQRNSLGTTFTDFRELAGHDFKSLDSLTMKSSFFTLPVPNNNKFTYRKSVETLP